MRRGTYADQANGRLLFIPQMDMLLAVGLKDRKNFLDYSLNPALEGGWVRMLYPNSPRHPRQKYLLTVKGVGLYERMK